MVPVRNAGHQVELAPVRARAAATAAALAAALEGARTIARLERTPAIFEALAAVSVQGWATPEEVAGSQGLALAWKVEPDAVALREDQ